LARAAFKSPVAGKRPPRRSQAERRDAMRERLLKATLACLARDGYAATTVSSIVKQAGVSRGAHVHHYPSKDALILDAADYLMRRAYRILGQLMLSIADEDNRLQALIEASWNEIFSTRLFRAFFELLTASQHDAELAHALQDLALRTLQRLEQPIAHYFEPLSPSSESPRDLFRMTQWMLTGMSAGVHLLREPEELRPYLDLWVRLMAGHMRARKGVTTPPPRPADWDQLAGG
jgi:AcrR family transcriptional regulator